MLRSHADRSGWLLAGMLAILGCSAPAEPERETAPTPATAPRAPIGLMTSLPLYWPPGGIAAAASGTGAIPWQRSAIEARYTIVPLDTLSPVPALAAGAPDTDPLAELDRLAVIQPRGLSPADNVALDQWVRGGGRLLLALDPALTGEYDAPLGDPRRPVDTALIPPVVARWGLAVSFDESQEPAVSGTAVGEVSVPLAMAGRITLADPGAADCVLSQDGSAAVCRVGAGKVTIIADAGVFEHPELGGNERETLSRLLAATLD